MHNADKHGKCCTSGTSRTNNNDNRFRKRYDRYSGRNAGVYDRDTDDRYRNAAAHANDRYRDHDTQRHAFAAEHATRTDRSIRYFCYGPDRDNGSTTESGTGEDNRAR